MIQGSESRTSHTVCKWNGSSHSISFYNTMYNTIQNALPSLDRKHRYDFKRWSQQVTQRKGERNRMNASVTSSFFTNATDTTTSIFSFLAQNITTTATFCATTSWVLHTTLWVYYDVKYEKAAPTFKELLVLQQQQQQEQQRQRKRQNCFFPFAKYYNRFCYCSKWGKEDHTRSFASFVSFLLFSLGKAGEWFVRGGAKREVASERLFCLYSRMQGRPRRSGISWAILDAVTRLLLLLLLLLATAAAPATPAVQHMLRMCRSAAFRRQQHLVNIPAAAGAAAPDPDI